MDLRELCLSRDWDKERLRRSLGYSWDDMEELFTGGFCSKHETLAEKIPALFKVDPSVVLAANAESERRRRRREEAEEVTYEPWWLSESPGLSLGDERQTRLEETG